MIALRHAFFQCRRKHTTRSSASRTQCRRITLLLIDSRLFTWVLLGFSFFLNSMTTADFHDSTRKRNEINQLWRKQIMLLIPSRKSSKLVFAAVLKSSLLILYPAPSMPPKTSLLSISSTQKLKNKFRRIWVPCECTWFDFADKTIRIMAWCRATNLQKIDRGCSFFMKNLTLVIDNHTWNEYSISLLNRHGDGLLQNGSMIVLHIFLTLL